MLFETKSIHSEIPEINYKHFFKFLLNCHFIDYTMCTGTYTIWIAFSRTPDYISV